MTVSPICVSFFRGTKWHVLKPVCHIQMCCWRTWHCQCSCSAIYPSIVLLPFSFSVDLLLFEFGDGFCCWLLWHFIQYVWKILSNVGRNLPHMNCIECTWILYLLLMCTASVLTWVISSSCAFLMLAGSVKLIQPTWLLSVILCLPKSSASASLFWVWYVCVMHHQYLKVLFLWGCYSFSDI